MPSSTFSSRAIGMLLAIFALPILLGNLAGRFYHPTPLSAGSGDLEKSARLVLLFGNSRFEAGVVPRNLAEALSEHGVASAVKAFDGGGWDSLHYYQLAILNADRLRPRRDAVVIEVSPLSENDFDATNRLGVIRPEATGAIVAIPGMPVETRLEMVLGKVSRLFAYRTSIQNIWFRPRLTAWSQRLADITAGLRIINIAEPRHPYTVITAPENEFVIDEVKGDQAEFLKRAQAIQERRLATLQFGGYKLEALRRAVERLRSRNVAVYLVEMPLSRWLATRVRERPEWTQFDSAIAALAAKTGARVLSQWSMNGGDERIFPDEEHMSGLYGERFTRELAREIENAGP